MKKPRSHAELEKEWFPGSVEEPQAAAREAREARREARRQAKADRLAESRAALGRVTMSRKQSTEARDRRFGKAEAAKAAERSEKKKFDMQAQKLKEDAKRAAAEAVVDERALAMARASRARETEFVMPSAARGDHVEDLVESTAQRRAKQAKLAAQRAAAQKTL